jgi:radical SAM superfamily enzyme YgiQ (UPF0313 family)
MKTTNILFIVLPYLIQQGNNTRSVLAHPYGVLSIASYLKANVKANLGIEILDLNLYEEQEIPGTIYKYMQKVSPDIVGISMMFDLSYRHLNGVAKQVKDYDSNTIVVVGGCAATVSWNTILREQEYLDAICYSEGEYTLRRLIESDDFHETLNNAAAWVTRKSISENITPQAKYVDNLNDVININYELIDVNSYAMKEAFSPFSSILDTDNIKQFFMVTSRGCPFKCVFCAEPSLGGKKMRYADVDVLIEHVRMLVEKYGMNVLTLYDAQLLFNRNHAKDFFKRLAEFKLRVETPNGLSVAFIDEEMAMLMKGAGIDTVPLAIESGSRRMLNEVIHKPLRLEQVKPVVEFLHRNNIFVQGYFVVGLPGEQEEDRDETVRFIKEVGLDWSGFNLATPLRGSELYKICKEKGYIDPSYGIGDLGMHDYVIKAPGLDPAYIKKKRYLMNLDVNFVNNHRMEIGDYKVAMLCFEDVVARYENHAFAYYYLAKASYALNNDILHMKRTMEKVNQIIAKDSIWKEYFDYFKINL